MALFLIASSVLLVLAQSFLVASLTDKFHPVGRSVESADATGLQEVFEVYQPVIFAPQGFNECDADIQLMDHVFGESYGAPFVGKEHVAFVAAH